MKNDITNKLIETYEYHRIKMIKAKDKLDFEKALYHQHYMDCIVDIEQMINKIFLIE